MTAAQRQASAPEASVWVDASAGTGKTKVLTDRVLRLLLGGTAPERILCLTFTRAAAAEMALRITDALARWTVADDAALAADLETLTGSAPGAQALDRARRLFADVLDVPGGMKIQTIHAFCQSLLRRFPIEAEIAPHFQIADERTSAELLGAARARLLAAARGGAGDPLADALARMTALVGETGFADQLRAVSDRRAQFNASLARHGGPAGLVSALRNRLGLAAGVTADGVLAEGSADEAFAGDDLRRAVSILAEGSATDCERAGRIEAWLDADPAARAAGIEDYRRAFFRQDGGRPKKLVTGRLDEKHPEVWPILAGEQDRLAVLFDRWNAARVAESTGALIEVAARQLALYREEKTRHAVLDYDDLIESGRGLLTRPGLAPWVLYKLDDGLDHLLIDEAQDTSPAQWTMIAAFADEFFAGEGAREAARTLFAVGDEKQSIFSFQGADVRAFVAARRRFRRQAEAARQKWQSLPLADSFRSTGAVLAVVDAVFARPAARAGVVSEEAPVHHGVTRAGAGGRVELWPPVVPEEAEEAEPPDSWEPVAREAADEPAARLAGRIAERVAGWMEGPATAGNGAWLEARGRRIRPGDILVLVRRRTEFVDHLMRALKARHVPVAGIDRMVLTEQIAVMDLIALGAFCLLPGDDLTLATVLKSPLIGLDEDALFDLAHGRDGERLWAVLARRRSEKPAFEKAYRALRSFLAAAASLRPFEFYTEALDARGGRAALLGRLGPESGDAIDEFLALALAYGRTHPPSLQGFLHWLQSGRAEITRDFEQGRDEVRIMTVHGAKGLEAPVVFLPDTMRKPRGDDPLVWLEEEGGGRETAGFLWPGRAAREEPLSRAARAEARAAADAEHRRLLYVAMTRAEDRLYVCGWRGRQKAPADCWYELARAGMRTLDRTEPLPLPDGGEGLVYVEPQTAALPAPPPAPPARRALPPVPPELLAPAPDEPAAPRPLAPSRALPEPALRSPIDAAGRSALARGTHAHRLLERLPSLDPADRPAAARRLLAASDLAAGEREALAEAVLALLSAPEYAALFGPEALAEAPVSAVVGDRAISGRIDRLLVGDREVIALDYKSGRAAPETADAVPRAWREQMAGYRAALAAVFPARRITCGLLFVDDPRLIWLPDETPLSG